MLKTNYMHHTVYQLEAGDLLTDCEKGSYAVFDEEEGWWVVKVEGNSANPLSTDPVESRAAAFDILARHLSH
ncbi:hypothetical protein [Nissabacter sp. SGAir0207]|uniref:hypothetical protein n=1 Tax=Nissabacter sp. SGAir0207 TaxID=2126321 RepID=UPI0010CD595E|nr:hypothetical protein [Nissabacter sp. SGAir0207]QCR35537.1 hypothetical protein C1N62_05260 [Nissabacter sp. SGAir0207]